jgi:tRNA (guanine37-N1)-methyltransferase
MEHPQNSEKEQCSKSSSSCRPTLSFHFISLFPDVFKPVLESSLLGKAQKKGLVSYAITQIRDFATDKHRTVDDTPFGGSEGMLLKPDVLFTAWESAKKACLSEQQSQPPKTATLLLSPQGQLLDQNLARELTQYDHLILVCGHYEGVDERFIELCVDREVSIGDYVLTGGELPALVVADAVTRLVPGVVGNERSLSEDSLERGLVKYPQYTRPREFQGRGVPEVLLSGDHRAIAVWRDRQMRERTQRKRPDLWQKFILKNKTSQ